MLPLDQRVITVATSIVHLHPINTEEKTRVAVANFLHENSAVYVQQGPDTGVRSEDRRGSGAPVLRTFHSPVARCMTDVGLLASHTSCKVPHAVFHTVDYTACCARQMGQNWVCAFGA